MVEAEYGVVRQTERTDGGEQRFGVEITVPGVCDRCVIKDNCYGAGSVVWAQSPDRLEPGDTVRLEMRRGTVLLATTWVYGLPLAAVMIGTLLGYELFSSQPEQSRVLLSFALGAGLMLLTGFVLSRLNSWVGNKLHIVAVRE